MNRSISHHDFIQKENAPSFVKRNNLERFKIEDRYLRNFETKSMKNESTRDRRDLEFYHCSVTLEDCILKNSYAFGTGISVGSGGALFVSSSQLQISGTSVNTSSYCQNSAGTGGAVVCIDCVISISNTGFENNTAFKNAGAFYAAAVIDVMMDNIRTNRYHISETQCFIMNCLFNENVATELGGALYILYFGTTYVEGCNFTSNKVGHSGAVAFISKAEPTFRLCNFIGNLAGNRTTLLTKSLFDVFEIEKGNYSKAISNMRRNHNGGLMRGGGAISFNVIKDDPDDDHSPFPTNHPEPSWDITGGNRRFVMVTSECCFNNNVAFNINNNESSSIIILSGRVQYDSINDNFNTEQKRVVAVNELVVENAQGDDGKNEERGLYNFFNYGSNATELCPGGNENITQTDYDSEGKPAVPNEKTKQYQPGVPKPTTFVYPETPLTRPYSSNITYEMSLNQTFSKPFSRPETISAIRTPSRTVSASPSPSEIPPTPKPTPSRSVGKFSRKTNVLTESPIFVESDFWISHYSFTQTLGEVSLYWSITYGSFSPWASEGTVISYTEAYTEWIDYSDGQFQIGPDEDEDGPNTVAIVIGCIAGILLLIVAVLLIWFFVFRKNNDEDTDPEVECEINEETVQHIEDAAPITNDNPLWNSSVIEDKDDPFRNDFEEDSMEGFTRVRHGLIE